MTRFLIDENVNQRAIRNVPRAGKGFDVLFPEGGSYKTAEDEPVRKIANSQQRVLVSQERDFGQFHLRPEDVPCGAIWLRPQRTSQKKTGGLLQGLCRVLVSVFPSDPYNFRGKIVEVFPGRVVIHESAGRSSSYQVPMAGANDDNETA
jgi:predicted nuclease of predicted toxin-antitoxin system